MLLPLCLILAISLVSLRGFFAPAQRPAAPVPGGRRAELEVPSGADRPDPGASPRMAVEIEQSEPATTDPVENDEWALRGVVVDSSGGPIVGALVWDERGELVATSDEAGAFVVSLDTRGERGEILLTTAEGYSSFRTLFLPGRTEKITLWKGCRFRGRLLRGEGDRPIAGQRLDIRSEGGSSWALTSDSEGRFALWAGAGDLLHILVLLEGTAPWSVDVAVLEEGGEVDFHVPVATGITAEVTHFASGAPIAGAEVSASGALVGLTDQAGRLRYDGFLDQAENLTFRAAGFCDARFHRESGQVEVVARLLPEARLFGFVREADGPSLPEAQVRLSVKDQRGPSGKDPPEGLLSRGQVMSTGQDGGFSFGGLGTRHGTFTALLRARAPGYATRDVQVAMTNGEEQGPIEVILEKGGTIRGRVTTESGPAQASVFLEGAEGDEVHTNDEGAFLLDGVSAGLHEVVAYLDEFTHATTSATVRVDPGENASCDLRLRMTMGFLEGYVLTEAGRPEGNARMLCTARGYHEEDPILLETLTEPNGRYRLELPASIDGALSTYDLSLERWEADAHLRDIPATAQPDLIVAESALVRVLPVASDTGQLLGPTDATMIQWEGSGAKRHCWTQRQLGGGVVEFKVPTGPATIELQGRGLRSERIEVELTAGSELDLGRVEMTR